MLAHQGDRRCLYAGRFPGLRRAHAGMGRVGRRRQTARVPANARQSRICTRLVPARLRARQRRQQYSPICRAFVPKPSDGLEPSTPSLPWRFWGGTGGHGPALAITFLLQILASRRVGRVRECPRVLDLTYPSRTRGPLSVSQTHDTSWDRQPAPTASPSPEAGNGGGRTHAYAAMSTLSRQPRKAAYA